MTDDRLYDDLFIDFDDTLCDTRGSADAALHEVFTLFHFDRYFSDPSLFFTAYWEANIDLWQRYGKGEITRDYLIVERFRRPLSLGDGLEATPKLCLAVNDHFLKLCVEKAFPVKGARELTDYLRRRGYRLHLVSNGFHELQYDKLRNCGLQGCFDTVILSEDAGVNKPLRGFFDYAFRVSGATPHRTLMIGDGWDSDMEGALDYGLATIFFNRFPDYPAPRPVTHEVVALDEIMTIL